jgi:DNA-binding sugar fermentation-stimulating protein
LGRAETVDDQTEYGQLRTYNGGNRAATPVGVLLIEGSDVDSMRVHQETGKDFSDSLADFVAAGVAVRAAGQHRESLEYLRP